MQVYVKSMYCYLSKEIYVRGKIHLCLVKKQQQQKAFAKPLCASVCARHKLSHLILMTMLKGKFSYS